MHYRFSVVALAALLAVAPTVARAMAGTDSIPNPVTDVEAADRGWPRGSLPLMNDPLRVAGQHHWFSELPNATYLFDYRADSTADVNRLVDLLSKIEGVLVVVELSPLAGPPRGMNEKAGPVAARLTMTSQRDLDRWFEHLTPAGREKFRTFVPPLAPPPTLTVYLGHPRVEPTKLQVPTAVTVVDGTTPGDRQEAEKDRALADRIEAVALRVGRHKADQLNAGPATRPAK
ncbi:MAG TPA: hypothetical protein VF796_03540 [Humisphaera sp.]